MKSNIVVSIIFISFLIVGCSSTGNVQDGTKISDQPEWVQNLGRYGKGIGYAASAPKSPLGTNTQLNQATMNARNELARQIEIGVKNAISQTIEQSREAGNEFGNIAASQFNADDSRQIANQTLAGSRPIKQWKDPKNDELWVWVVIDKKNVIARVSESMRKALRKGSKLHNEKLEIMDKIVDKEANNAF
jgi:hypothetical protein